MTTDNKYSITPDMINEGMVEYFSDWSDGCDTWQEVISRGLNAAIRLGLVVAKKQFDDAVEQDYCTICGRILEQKVHNLNVAVIDDGDYNVEG